MRKVTMALAVLALLAVASTSFAGVTFSSTLDESYSQAGYCKYVVSSTGTMALENLRISLAADGEVADGLVQQAQFFGAASIYSDSLYGQEPVTSLDTHFLFTANDILVGTGTILEPGIPSGMPGQGLGTFGGDMAFSWKNTSVVADWNILQVILPVDRKLNPILYLNGTAVDFATDTKVGFSCPINVPEPGTVMMLVAGALCLLAVRFRK